MINHFHTHVETEADLQIVGSRLAHAIGAGAVIFLHGPLGAGKTTFVRGFLRGLGFSGKVKSPTYTLVEPYHLSQRDIFHFDFYRLNNASELEHIGIQEYFHPAAICLIEWPDKGFPLLPQADLTCYIAFSEPGRDIRLVAHTAGGQASLSRLQKE